MSWFPPMKKVHVSSLSILAVSCAGWWYYASAANTAKPQAPKRPPVQVATSLVDAQSLSSSLSLVGNLDAVRSLEVASEITGKVDRIAVSANQKVKKGQLLIEIDPVKAKAALLEAKAYYTDEQRKLEDYRKLIKRSAITQTELDAQQASVDIAKARMDVAQANYDDHFIRAPFSGVVGLIDFSIGKLVNAGETLFTLDDLSTMQLDVNVPEQHLGDLHTGLVVEAGNQAWPEDTFSGKLENVDTRVNSDSLNVRAVFCLPTGNETQAGNDDDGDTHVRPANCTGNSGSGYRILRYPPLCLCGGGRGDRQAYRS